MCGTFDRTSGWPFFDGSVDIWPLRKHVIGTGIEMEIAEYSGAAVDEAVRCEHERVDR